MLRSIKKLRYSVAFGINGVIGIVDRIFFDGSDWNIRVFGIIDESDGKNDGQPKVGPEMLFFIGDLNKVTWDKSGLHFHSEKPISGSMDEQGKSFISSTDLLGSKLVSRDGNPGYVDDLAVDELSWKIQYFLVISKPHFGSRRIMLPPSAIVDIVPNVKKIKVDLTTRNIFEFFSV